MIKKNILLASAALMTLGMAGSVNADEKATSESVAVATTPEKDVKPVAEVAANTEVKPAAETSVKEESKTTEVAPAANEKKTETQPKTTANPDVSTEDQILEWANRLESMANAFGDLDLEITDKFDLDIFLQAYYFNMRQLKGELADFTKANGASKEIDDLMQGVDAYLNAVSPVMDALNEVNKMYKAGELTKEEMLAEVEAILMAADEDSLAEDTQEKTAAPEKKAEVSPVNAPIETLPETGSDAKSYISVIGAALAGLTVWGFGFKKRG